MKDKERQKNNERKTQQANNRNTAGIQKERKARQTRKEGTHKQQENKDTPK